MLHYIFYTLKSEQHRIVRMEHFSTKAARTAFRRNTRGAKFHRTAVSPSIKKAQKEAEEKTNIIKMPARRKTTSKATATLRKLTGKGRKKARA